MTSLKRNWKLINLFNHFDKIFLCLSYSLVCMICFSLVLLLTYLSCQFPFFRYLSTASVRSSIESGFLGTPIAIIKTLWIDSLLRIVDYYMYTCKIVIRVSAPFTEDDYCGKGERPNTGLADNSPFTCKKTSSKTREEEHKWKEISKNIYKY